VNRTVGEFGAVSSLQVLNPMITRSAQTGRRLMKSGGQRVAFARDALWQSVIARAQLDFIIAGIAGRTTGKYGAEG
jgi:hypothetical protein